MYLSENYAPQMSSYISCFLKANVALNGLEVRRLAVRQWPIDYKPRNFEGQIFSHIFVSV